MRSLLSELNKVMLKHRDLALAGFKSADYEKRSGATFEDDRREMPKYQDAFLQSLTFLQMVSRQRVCNYRFHTKEIKGFVEQWSRRHGERVYVPEGIFIAAALACGFTVSQRNDLTYMNAKLDGTTDGSGVKSGKFVIFI
jgi:hypothetical protein